MVRNTYGMGAPKGWALTGMMAMAGLCWVSKVGFCELATSHLSRVALSSGWNLRVFPSTRMDFDRETHSAEALQIWGGSMFHSGSPEHGQAKTTRVDADGALERGQVYWVWSKTDTELVFLPDGQSDPLPRAASPGWHAMWGADLAARENVKALRVLWWNPRSQSYESVVAPQSIASNQGYWGHLPEPDHAENAFASEGGTPGFDGVFTELGAEAVALQTATENYGAALIARDRLFRMQESQDGSKPWGYQVEYAPDPTFEALTEALEKGARPPLASPAHSDSWYLAGFERVWAYTQGVALAQLSRGTGAVRVASARALARFLCAHAQKGEARDQIAGWPFSWNTRGDVWRDARLVTGANAWVVHGLGSFITSDAYATLRSDTEKKQIQDCYRRALHGLRAHARTLTLKGGQKVVLMTAGTTAAGLKYAATPHRIKTASGAPVSSDSHERLSYYSVLDAIGYGTFSTPPKIKTCLETPKTDCYTQPSSSPVWQEREIAEPVWAALRQPQKADNVVTEHNLDVLAVLNHAIEHQHDLGLEDGAALRAWRDALRDGIFYALWDEQGYKDEFRAELRSMATTPVAQTDAQRAWQSQRRQWMEEALLRDDLGRIVTGGEIRQHENGEYHLEPSVHSAIDNCSWLSLSVDHRDLKKGGRQEQEASIYVRRLRQCLQYTVIRYVRDLGFDEGGKTYRGAHYFQNTFTDPYIVPSALQERSYHLEATMGLILGLRAFAKAHPEDGASAGFQKEAQGLWWASQDFVRDHGFVYSSQRIQDLSTRLSSSTAILWFIDVYNDFKSGERLLDQALLASLVDETRGPFLVVKGKTVSQAAKWATKYIDQALHLPAGLAASVVGASNAVGYLAGFGLEADVGLETILIGDGPPSDQNWSYQGTVAAEDVVAQPLGQYLRDESELRQDLRIQPPGEADGRSGPGISLDESTIYYIQAEWIGGGDTPFGPQGFLAPAPGAEWPVFALESTKTRSQILHAFVQRHPLWEQTASITQGLPDALRPGWVQLLELSIRSTFDARAAEAVARAGVQSEGVLGLEDDGLSRGTRGEVVLGANLSVSPIIQDELGMYRTELFLDHDEYPQGALRDLQGTLVCCEESDEACFELLKQTFDPAVVQREAIEKHTARFAQLEEQAMILPFVFSAQDPTNPLVLRFRAADFQGWPDDPDMIRRDPPSMRFRCTLAGTLGIEVPPGMIEVHTETDKALDESGYTFLRWFSVAQDKLPVRLTLHWPLSPFTLEEDSAETQRVVIHTERLASFYGRSVNAIQHYHYRIYPCESTKDRPPFFALGPDQASGTVTSNGRPHRQTVPFRPKKAKRYCLELKLDDPSPAGILGLDEREMFYETKTRWQILSGAQDDDTTAAFSVDAQAVSWSLDAFFAQHVRDAGHTGAEVDLPVGHAGGRLVFVKGKSVSRTAQAAVQLIDDLLRLPKELVATAFAGSSALGYLSSLGTEADVGLETIFIGADVPSEPLWRFEGRVEASATLAQPLGTYLLDEESLRSTVSIYADAIADDPTLAPNHAFDDDRIYYIRTEWIGLDSPVTGRVGVLAPSDRLFWDVYALDTANSRSAVLDAFFQNHPLWKKVASLTESLPESFREPWLFLVELGIRGDFDRPAAERYAATLDAKGPPGLGPTGPAKDPNTPPPDDGTTVEKTPRQAGEAGASGEGNTPWLSDARTQWLAVELSKRDRLRWNLVAVAQGLAGFHPKLVTESPTGSQRNIFDDIAVHKTVLWELGRADARLEDLIETEDLEPQKVSPPNRTLPPEEVIRNLRTRINFFVARIDAYVKAGGADNSAVESVPEPFQEKAALLLKSLDALDRALEKLPAGYRSLSPVQFLEVRESGGDRAHEEAHRLYKEDPSRGISWIVDVGLSEVYRDLTHSDEMREWFPEWLVVHPHTTPTDEELQGIDYVFFIEDEVPMSEIVGTVRSGPELWGKALAGGKIERARWVLTPGTRIGSTSITYAKLE